jgi:hypothetical protein
MSYYRCIYLEELIQATKTISQKTLRRHRASSQANPECKFKFLEVDQLVQGNVVRMQRYLPVYGRNVITTYKERKADVFHYILEPYFSLKHVSKSLLILSRKKQCRSLYLGAVKSCKLQI